MSSSSDFSHPPPLPSQSATFTAPPFYPFVTLPPPRNEEVKSKMARGTSGGAVRGGGGGPGRGRKEYATEVAAANSSNSGVVVNSLNYKDHFDKDTLDYVLEDIRLSTLQKKLARELNSGVALALACQVSESIIYQDNRTYVRRSTDIICDAIVDIFYSKHSEAVKTESANGLGKVGFVVAEQQEFAKFYRWLWDGYRKAKNEKVQALFLKSLLAILKLRPNLPDQEINLVMTDLLDDLEKTENSTFMMVLVESLSDISKWKSKLFEPNFQNVVDILVGWHIDSSQTPAVRSYMSSILLSWHSYWITDMEFSSSLLRQFTEDMDEDIRDPGEFGEVTGRVLSLVQVFNTVLSCLCGTREKEVTFLPPEISRWCGTILDCLLVILKKTFNEDLMVAGQHACIMIMERIESVFADHTERMTEFIECSVASFPGLSFSGKISVMKFLTRMYSLLDTPHQPRITKIILSAQSPLFEAIFSMDKRVAEGAMDMFRILLNSKNIFVLQEVYCHLTALYEESLVQLANVPRFIANNSSSKFQGLKLKQHQCQSVLFFVLGSLSNIAAAKGSVLSMWALDPSMFSLLLQKEVIQNDKLMSEFPLIHHAILKLCLSHCSRHNFFATSSGLLNTGSQMSPTALYLEQIMATVSTLVGKRALLGASMKLVMQWSKEILLELEGRHYVQLLKSKPEYRRFVSALQAAAVTSQDKGVVTQTLQILNQVVGGGIGSTDPSCDIIDKMNDVAVHHLKSTCPEIQTLAVNLLMKLPPLLSEWRSKDSLSSQRRHYKAMKSGIIQASSNKPLRLSEFKTFIEAILRGPMSPASSFDKGVIANLEKKLPRESEDVKRFQQMLLHQDFKAMWVGVSVAQHCINNKLKTSLGKAQDTLTTVEKTLRSVVQSLKEGNTKLDLQQCHNFLVFFECLEKALCNAYDGSAVTLGAPNKSVATFFSANKKTCVDWLTRLRVALIQFAFMTDNFSCVVRNANEILPKMIGKEQQQNDEQLQLVVAYLASSLVRLKCPEGLSGLHSWCKEQAGKNFPWIKSLIELARNGTESGIATLKAELSSSSVQQPAKRELGPEVANIISQELFLGYEALSECKQYEEFMSAYREENASPVKSIREDYLRALAEFNDGEIPLAWKDYTFDASEFDSGNALFSTHLLLFQTVACFQSGYSKLPSWADSEKLTKGLEKASSCVLSLMKEHALTHERRLQTLILSQVQKELANLCQNKSGNLEVLLAFRNKCHSSKILIQIKKWGDFFTKYRKTNPQLHFQLSSLDLEIAKRGRKERNFRLANAYLQKSLFQGSPMPNIDLASYLDGTDFVNMPLSVDKASCLRQCAKLFFLCNKKETAIATVCGIASSIGAMACHDPSNSTDLLEVSSRGLHNMTNWFKNNPKLLEDIYPDSMTSAPTISNVLDFEQSMTGVLDFLPSVESASDSDMVMGRLLRLSILQSPQLAKLWHSLAEWALGLGEQSLADKEKFNITDEERQSIAKALPNHFGSDAAKVDQVLRMLQDSRLEQNEKMETELRRVLLRCGVVVDPSDDATLQNLQEAWLAIKKRRFFYHETAVSAFFQFIALSAGESEEKLIAATLRLLQLTVKHGLELQESLQCGLESTDCSKWKAIIPQLFSRLNHPVRMVRNRISDLLCRLAQDYPHLIIFPAVVGGGGSSSSSSTSSFAKMLTTMSEDSEIEVEFGSAEEEAAAAARKADPYMQNAYAQIVESMKKQNMQSVEQVQRFVFELQRISLLWDELWLGTLQQYNQDIAKRVKKMEEEVQRLSDNKTLTSEEKRLLVQDKYHIIFKPLLYVLDKIVAVTSKEPETPHEKSFVGKYGNADRGFIKDLMCKLHNPANPAKPGDSWNMLVQLQASLSNKSVMKTNLKFINISPSLYAMTKAHIPMPGVTRKSGLTVESIDNNLTILLTKTKPKRVAFCGSDGNKYSYLFKGLEDLHLDERIMQFLSIANIMMKKKGGEFKARHYAVVPLGPRSGLISWVEGAIPMFSLFKKWQLRQQLPATDGRSAAEKKGIAFQKPSDVFYNKIFPLLRDNKVTNLDSRRNWPLPVMKQAMQELVAETPDSILRQEIWFASTNSDDWFSMVQNLTVSFAVMSVIGYIIGLGDRHMDNLLLDLEEGEIIHIDYNVCFEKGKHLRIPERVPCRLTQNIVALFGLSGTDGLFRNSCEVTLETLRQGKETLMCLLEAFVYDPLVDWTPGVELGIAGAYHGGRQNDLGFDKQDKRDMQAEITFSMFGVRVAEMKGPWADNKSELLQVVSDIEDRLGAWVDLKIATDSMRQHQHQQHHSMSVLKEAESNANHRLYSLVDRFTEHNLMENAVQISRAAIGVFVEENERWSHVHQRALASLSPHQMAKWTTEITTTSVGPSSTSSMVKEFLEKAGQSSLLEQFEAVENGFCIGIEKLKQNLLACIQLLGHYVNLSSLYPASYKFQHRNVLYVKWATELAENFSVRKCQEIVAEFSKEFVEESEERRLKQHHVLNLNYQMENWTQEINFRMQNIFQRMINEKIESSAAVMTDLTSAKLDLHLYLTNESNEVRTLLNDLMIGTLSTLERKLMSLESQAFEPTGNFIDMTDGEWFLLDQIHMQIGHVVQVFDTMDFLGVFSTDSLAGKAFYKLQNVLKQLNHFNSSFFGIILHEGLKCFQKEDASVITLAVKLAEIINDTGLTLEELVEELEVEIRYTVSGMPLSNEATVNVAKNLKDKYSELVRIIGGCQERGEGLSSGQMLFLAFDSLFNSIDGALTDLKTTLLVIDLPEEWIGVDVIAESKKILEKTLNPELFELLELTTFVNRLLVIKEYFSMCTRSMICFKADSSTFGEMLPTGDEIARPVKIYLAEYYRQQMVGLGSFSLAVFLCCYIAQTEPILLTNLPDKSSASKLSLEELTRAFLDKRLALPGKDRSHFLTLELDNISRLMKKVEVARYLEQNIEALHASQHINQLQRNSFQWFHEALLPLESITLVPPIRPNFLNELRNYLSILMLLHEEMVTLQNKYQELHGTVEQRLKWASGANPEMQDVLDNYSTSFIAQMESLKSIAGTMKVVISSANAILHFEAMRTQNRDAMSADANFMALLGDCQQSAALKESQVQSLSKQELDLFTINPPNESSINSDWIRKTETIIIERVRMVQEKLQNEQRKAKDIVLELQNIGRRLRHGVTEHQKLMSDVGALLRTISKSEDYDIPEVHNYLQMYKDFSEIIAAVIRNSSLDEHTAESIREMAVQVEQLKEILTPIYETIVGFSHTLKEDNLESFKVKKQPQQDKCGGEEVLFGKRGRSGEQKTTSSEEKNSFALNVLRRIRHKLDGREPDALKRASVQEQVDFLIRESTSIDNMALMYEGWTAWI